MKLFPLAIAAVAMLSACASPASMSGLNAAQQDYAATSVRCNSGDQYACTQMPWKVALVNQAQAQVNSEQAASAAVGLGVLAVGVAALDAATCCSYGYHYRYHHARWRHW